MRNRQVLSLSQSARLAGLAALLLLLFGPLFQRQAPGAAAQSDPIPLLAYYYIWFDPGSWDRAKRDLPLLGAYSSDDRGVMEQHVRWAKEVGFNGFIVSWKSTEPLNRRLAQLVEIAAQEQFKLVIIYQGLDFERRPLPVEEIVGDLEWLLETYAGEPVFNLFGRPVIVLSGSWEFSPEQVRQMAASTHEKAYLLATEREAGEYLRLAPVVDGNAYYWSSGDPIETPGYETRLGALGEAVHADRGLWIAPLAPGFDARLIGGARVVERREGETLRQGMAAALEAAPDALGLISWNEFSENTHVEPSVNHGMRYLEVIAELREAAPPAPINFASDAPAETAPQISFDRLLTFVLLIGLGLGSMLVLGLRGRTR